MSRRCLVLTVLMMVLSVTVQAEEPAYAFRNRLETVHEHGRRDAAAEPHADEFVFRDGCCVPTADFADYLNVSMGVRATVGVAKGDVSVVLDHSLREREYTVDVDATGVVIRAYDERARDQALYHLEDLMNLRRAPFLAFGHERRRMRYSPRMTHSGWGLDKFPDAHLRQLAHQGFDAILLFLTGVDETQGGGRNAGINDIVDRAFRAGLDTYLYSKVPVFAHPDNPEGARKLRETFGAIAAAHPKAKGIVFVGESAEFPSRDERTCGLSLSQERPKGETRPLPGWYPCRDYPDWLTAVQTALHEKSPGLEIVFWTYNWSDCPPEQGAELLKNFPPEVAIESTFGPGERHCYRNGLEVVARDYTLSVPGPNRHFELESAAAAEGKRKLYAMSNTGGLTWDYGVVPYQPCPYQWKKRWNALRATNGLVGLMESHHFGCWPSFVTELAKEAFTEGGIPFDEHLRKIAMRDFGEGNVETVLSVWKDWSEAAADYVATNENQYGPFRLGPAYPFNFGGNPIAEGEFPQGKGATHVMRWMAYLNYPYDKAAADSLNVVYESISPEERRMDLDLLLSMREKWMSGADRLRVIADTLCNGRRRTAERMADLGEWHARTVATAIALRRGQAAFAAGDRKALVAIAAEERRNAVAALELAKRDSRLGWEPSMEYVGGPEQLQWKIERLDRLFDRESALVSPVDRTHDDAFMRRYSESACQIATRKMKEITDAGFSARLPTGGDYNGYFLWDTAFCVLWARYLGNRFPIEESLDNFYRFAQPDGYIARQFDAQGRIVYAADSSLSFAPPLLAWAEMELFRTRGKGTDRLVRVYPALVRHHRSLVRFRRSDGLYFSDALGCGMDELPRGPRDTNAVARCCGGIPVTIDAVMPYARERRWEWLKNQVDHFGWNNQAGWIDTSSQVALDCLALAEMAEAIGRAEEAASWRAEHKHLAETINRLCWNEELGFYCDHWNGGTIPRRHAGGFWTLISRVATPERAARIAKAFTDSEAFGRPIPLPCLPADDPDYRPESGYWCGGVWPPTNYIAVRGLLAYGYDNLAEDIARRWYNANAELFVRTGTVYENISPERCDRPREQAGRDFCGWGALVPVALPREFGWLDDGNAFDNAMERK